MPSASCPNADAVLYVNLEPVRLLTDLGKKPPKNREPEYEEFVRQTGFEFERDLNRAALAIHYGHTAGNPASETRYSEILQGQFDNQRVSQYLRKLSQSVERYNDFDIYVIPLEGRTLRVVSAGSGHRSRLKHRGQRRHSRHGGPLQTSGTAFLRDRSW